MRSQFADDELLTQGLVADILSVSKETVRKWEKRGTIVPVSASNEGEPLYRWSDLHAFPVVRQMLQSSWDQESRILPARKFRSIELFAGAGGLALGLEASGFDSVAFNEIDHDACETLRKNRPEWNVIEGDIENIDFTQFHDIDLVSGGFPCQAFSYAGNRFGFEDTRGTLFFQFARAIREIQPRVFLGENVRGLLTHDKGRTIGVIKGAIREIGYTLIEPQVLKALFYKVPQKRERLFLVGIRNDLAHHQARFKWPDPAQRVYTVRDALKKGDLYPTDVPDSQGVLYTKWKTEIIARIPQGGYWRDLPIQLQKQLLKGSFHLEGGKTGIGRRLSWNEPSLTLTCAPAQNQTGRCHPEETRPLTVREYARIQTFPDDWDFCGSTMSQYKQIGNAVPVNLAAAVGRRLVALLNEMEAEAPDFSLQHPAWRHGIRYPDGAVQMLLLEPSTMYLVDDSPVTLLGTYRKSCREWIVSSNLYNYPVTDSEIEKCQPLRSVSRLILVRKNDSRLFFKVKGYEIVGKRALSELGYPTGTRHPASQKYILYKLEPLETELAYDEAGAIAIAGKGANIKKANRLAPTVPPHRAGGGAGGCP
ncbi:MAG: DNA (cytosine-5-)-methyltransferase [Lentisphaerae bacterium]|jgi:DNA (cytosine-5)-methyltransferase 1|nr:DNA (cytosine-5-)-methyltransferase [Lentisphaerota bacterium]